MVRPALAAFLLVALVVGCATDPADGEAEAPSETRELPTPEPKPPQGAVGAEISPRDDSFVVSLDAVPEAAEVEVRISRMETEEIVRTAVYRIESGGVVRVPTVGLRSGERYLLEFRYIDGEYSSPWSEGIELFVASLTPKFEVYLVDALDRYPIERTPATESLMERTYFPLSVGPPATVDRTPDLQVSPVTGSELASISVRLTDASPGEPIMNRELPGDGGAVQVENPLEQGEYGLELTAVGRSGVELEPVTYRVVVGQAVAPEATAHGDGTSPVRRPTLRWSHQVGVPRYELSLGRAQGEESEATEEVEGTLFRLPEELLIDGETYSWRVRPLLADGPGEWSEAYRFQYEPIEFPFSQIVPPGESVTFMQGGEEGSADEAPAQEVTLTRPFEMAVYEMSNRLAAALFSSALAHGRVTMEEGVVFHEDRPLLSLDTLEYGEQFGLALGDDGLIESVVGRATHPVVGVSWYGAVALARELSFLEGRTVSRYEGPSADAAAADRWTYRLPTEAEWEYAATGGDGRRFPWGEESPEGRSNYYRSGDEFEDFNPPYTRNGGPTTPVGYFREESPFGVRDLVGNVWEWCFDWYDPERYAVGAAVDPRGPSEPVEDRFGVLNRSLRGLAWNSRVEDLRSANRGKYPPDSASWSIGVRLLRSP